MKINKVTTIVLGILTVLFGLATMVFQQKNLVIAEMASSLFTGCIVSIVVAIIGYFHEEGTLKYKLQNNIKSLYINMLTLKDVTGNILVQIAKTTNLSDLRFNDITSLAGLNIEFVNGMELEAYDGFYSNSKMAHIYIDFIKYKNKMYNLKNIAAQIGSDSLKHNIQVLNFENQRLSGLMINPQEIEYAESLKNKLNIMTAKLHEYEASLLIELDDLADRFYKIGIKKSDWNEVKTALQNEAEDILSIKN